MATRNQNQIDSDKNIEFTKVYLGFLPETKCTMYIVSFILLHLDSRQPGFYTKS